MWPSWEEWWKVVFTSSYVQATDSDVSTSGLCEHNAVLQVSLETVEYQQGRTKVGSWIQVMVLVIKIVACGMKRGKNQAAVISSEP
jgi:hypothetical protein